MPLSDLVARLTLEFWRASGARTEDRLAALFIHYAEAYRLNGDQREESWRRVRGVGYGEIRG